MFDPNAEAIALRRLALTASGTPADFRSVVHAEAVDQATGARGPAAAHAASLRLRAAFADLAWDVHEVVAERDLAVVHCTMSGRHVRPYVARDRNGAVTVVLPPTGGPFAVEQTHWFRVADGKVVEHWTGHDPRCLSGARRLARTALATWLAR